MTTISMATLSGFEVDVAKDDGVDNDEGCW